MSDQTILREYLVALGFKIDKAAQAKFGQGLSALDKTAGTLGKTILGITAAATGMTIVFAKEMEKMYYASRRAGSTIGNMQALEFGFGQIGLTGEKARSALEGMSRAIRSNPGLVGLLNSLGVQVTGRDKADVLTDLITQLKKMPSHIAEQYANIFGIDPDTLFMLKDGLDKMKEGVALRKKMAAEAGVDLDKTSAATLAYSNALKETAARVELLYNKVSSLLLPGFLEFTLALNDNLRTLGQWVGQFNTLGEMWAKMTGKGTPPTQAEVDRKATNFVDWLTKPMFMNPQSSTSPATVAPPAAPSAPSVASPSGDSKEARLQRLSDLEDKYSLPKGMLARVWKTESQEGNPKFMRSGAGAKGHFQFMDKTAKQYGVTDPDDFDQSSAGAAKMMADLSRKYGGDAQKMAAAYNWGQGNLDRYGLGAAPAETRDYVGKVAPQINQTNNITVTGSSDPQQTARAIGEQQRVVNADLTRNFTPRAR